MSSTPPHVFHCYMQCDNNVSSVENRTLYRKATEAASGIDWYKT